MGGGGGGSGGRVLGGQDGCERRIEVFVKIPKKKNGGVGVWGRVGGGGGVRVDVNEDLKILRTFKKKLGGGVGGGVGGSGWM